MVSACVLAVCSFTYRFLLPNGTPNLVNLLIADLHNTTFYSLIVQSPIIVTPLLENIKQI